MSRFYYDLHIHSCLSPCADNDMTPGNIAGMATLAGLDIAALTDHNSVANCPAFFSAAAAYGIVPIIELIRKGSGRSDDFCLIQRIRNEMISVIKINFSPTICSRRRRLGGAYGCHLEIVA